ncbi:MAG TPA: methylmalonyl Co-A mutase-associated GTPase MeaB [Thermohalobaculum sp.]|nr:methylmalonyl Co-A mutase-associated GTPase MeaB [Thermohalobaculum sp.]
MGEPAEDVRPSLAERLLAGDRAALARALTLIERGHDRVRALMAALGPHLGHALALGFTGPPGAGKSTLVSAVVAALRRSGRSVAVIAVDPSSPISGGAILGDRLRMGEHAGDEGVFIRSFASRGHVGGLTPAAVRAIDAFDAAGFDVVILETVGAGQSDIDVAEVADLRVVLDAPGLGDDVQAMKAGILDIADVLVVNKGDAAGADALHRNLKGARGLSARGASTPVLRTVATTGEGVDALVETLDGLAEALTLTPAERRRRRARRLLAWAAEALVARLVGEGRAPGVDRLSDAILAAEIAPDDAARRLLAELAP